MKYYKCFFTFMLVVIGLSYYLFNIDYSLNITIKEVNECVVFYDNNDYLVGTRLNSDENIIEDIFDYLTINKNAAPLNFYSPLPDSLELEDYELSENSLTINLNKGIKEEDIDDIVPLIYESYHILGYETITIESEDFSYTCDRRTLSEMKNYKNYLEVDESKAQVYLYELEGDYITFTICSSNLSELVFVMDNLKYELDYYINNNRLYITNYSNVNKEELILILKCNFPNYLIYIDNVEVKF